MMLSTPDTALGIFDEPEQAAEAIRALKEDGFTDKQIGIASRECSRRFADMRVEEQHAAERGAVTGTLVGGGVGAVLGLVGAVLMPGAIPVIGGSALMGAIGGGLAGAAAGAVVRPGIALGFSEEEAKSHAELVQQGKTIVLVHEPQRKEEARKIMIELGAYDESMSSN